jgi:hypothetical protein
LAQPEAAMRMGPAKRGGQPAQSGAQVSARVCRKCGDLRGGAARLKNEHREKQE